MRTRELPRARDLTPEERARWCNGLGPKAGKTVSSKIVSWFLLALLRAAGVADLYRECGNDHDLYYTLGGDADDRLLYDLVFFGSMYETSVKTNMLARPIGRLFSYACFRAVRECGNRGPYVMRIRSLSLAELREKQSQVANG